MTNNQKYGIIYSIDIQSKDNYTNYKDGINMINKDKSLVDSINNTPTTNDESEQAVLKEQQASSAPPSNPLQAQMQGLGEHAAKMAGTPAARQGQLNAQEERLQQASKQADATANPQGQSVEDYYRTQDIQAQTLGRAQEEANKFEEEMKAVGSYSGSVGKYIMNETNAKLAALENESYTEELFNSTDFKTKFIDDLKLDAGILDDSEAKEAIGEFAKLLTIGSEPTELNLAQLQDALGLDDTKFTQVTQSIKDSVDSINLGEKLAKDLIDAEEVTLQVLMDADPPLISEADVRDSLGLFNGEPLPDGWQSLTFAELQARANQQFQEQADQLNQLAAMEGANFDAGRAYQNAAGRAEASEEMGQTVQFGDQLMSVGEFLSDDRIKRELNTFGRDFDFDLEGPELDAELKRLFGSSYEANPEHYQKLFNVAKENQGIIDNIDTSIMDADEAVDSLNQTLSELGPERKGEELLTEMFGINLNTWDLDANELAKAEEVLKDHGQAFINLKESDPEFWATLKKDPNQSWENYSQELQDKMAGVTQYKNIQDANKYVDANGNLKAGVNADDFLEDLYGIDKDQLLNVIKAATEWEDPFAKKFLKSLPPELQDGTLSNEEIKGLGLKGGLDLDSIGGTNLKAVFDKLSDVGKLGWADQEYETIPNTTLQKWERAGSYDKIKSNWDSIDPTQANIMMEGYAASGNSEKMAVALDMYAAGKLDKAAQTSVMDAIKKNVGAGLGTGTITNDRHDDAEASITFLNSLDDPQAAINAMRKGGIDVASPLRWLYNIGGRDDRIGSSELNALKGLKELMEKLPNTSLKDKFAVDFLIYRSEKGYVSKGLGRYWDASSSIINRMGNKKLTFEEWQNSSSRYDDDDD